jgi:hypothetical protein
MFESPCAPGGFDRDRMLEPPGDVGDFRQTDIEPVLE